MIQEAQGPETAHITAQYTTETLFYDGPRDPCTRGPACPRPWASPVTMAVAEGSGAPPRHRVVVAGGGNVNELGVGDVGGRRQPSLAIGGGWGHGAARAVPRPRAVGGQGRKGEWCWRRWTRQSRSRQAVGLTAPHGTQRAGSRAWRRATQ
jgi:hypothetical protein